MHYYNSAIYTDQNDQKVCYTFSRLLVFLAFVP